MDSQEIALQAVERDIAEGVIVFLFSNFRLTLLWLNLYLPIWILPVKSNKNSIVLLLAIMSVVNMP